MQADRFKEVPTHENLNLVFQHEFEAVVERQKIFSGKTHSFGDPSCTQVYKINEVHLILITYAIYPL